MKGKKGQEPGGTAREARVEVGVGDMGPQSREEGLGPLVKSEGVLEEGGSFQVKGRKKGVEATDGGEGGEGGVCEDVPVPRVTGKVVEKP